MSLQPRPPCRTLHVLATRQCACRGSVALLTGADATRTLVRAGYDIPRNLARTAFRLQSTAFHGRCRFQREAGGPPGRAHAPSSSRPFPARGSGGRSRVLERARGAGGPGPAHASGKGRDKGKGSKGKGKGFGPLWADRTQTSRAALLIPGLALRRSGPSGPSRLKCVRTDPVLRPGRARPPP